MAERYVLALGTTAVPSESRINQPRKLAATAYSVPGFWVGRKTQGRMKGIRNWRLRGPKEPSPPPFF
jgi:hypothetical protein